jgi:hypothetical protein
LKSEDEKKQKEKIKDQQNEVLVEDKDYYLENGLMVFTEAYHLKKGYCCKNNCRHCPYGYKNK